MSLLQEILFFWSIAVVFFIYAKFHKYHEIEDVGIRNNLIAIEIFKASSLMYIGMCLVRYTIT